MIMFVTTVTWERPPAMWPTTHRANSMSRRVTPPAFIREPASRKKGIASSTKLSLPLIIRWTTSSSGALSAIKRYPTATPAMDRATGTLSAIRQSSARKKPAMVMVPAGPAGVPAGARGVTRRHEEHAEREGGVHIHPGHIQGRTLGLAGDLQQAHPFESEEEQDRHGDHLTSDQDPAARAGWQERRHEIDGDVGPALGDDRRAQEGDPDEEHLRQLFGPGEGRVDDVPGEDLETRRDHEHHEEEGAHALFERARVAAKPPGHGRFRAAPRPAGIPEPSLHTPDLLVVTAPLGLELLRHVRHGLAEGLHVHAGDRDAALFEA